MDESEKKYKFFCCTIKSSEKLEYPLPKFDLVKSVFSSFCSEYTFQMEASSTGLFHYQCCFETKNRKRVKTVAHSLASDLGIPSSLVEVARSYDYEKSKLYCSDRTKRADSELFFSNAPISSPPYDGGDVSFLDNKEKRYPWQNTFINIFFEENSFCLKVPDDRTIYWIKDPIGNTGKSKFAKWLCFNSSFITKIPFGTSSQLRSSVIKEGEKIMYILDMPRTLGSDDSVSSVLSVVEDMKNGFLRSSMYGNSDVLFMKPPHIVIFSNRDCPLDKLSEDRWKIHYINYSKQLA